MEILNVATPRTDAENKEAEEQRLADLKEESLSDANIFFWAAAAAALGGGIALIKVNFLVALGAIDLLIIYGKSIGPLHPVVVYLSGMAWVVALVTLAIAARGGYRWAFLVGIVAYGADMIALVVTFSIWAFGLHAFFIYKWYQGQAALRELKEAKLRATTN